MDENNTTRAEYRPAPDFYPYNHADAIKGISEYLHELFTEGPATSLRHSNDLRASINGLIWIQQKLVRELHEWLVNIENLTDIELPIRAADFDRYDLRRHLDDGVKDARAIYAVK